MFKTFFKENNIQIKKSNIKTESDKKIQLTFIINEVFITMYNVVKYNYKKYFKKMTIYEKKNELYQLNKDFNRRFFYIKEEFYENIKKVNFFYILEWHLLYSINNINYKNTPKYVANFYYNKTKKILSNYKNNYKLFNNVYWGLLSFWKALKIWIFSFLMFIVSFYVLLVKRTGVLPQTIFFWIGFSMLLYWLISGFVFFVKKYQFSRYTSVIQRFWRRSYIIFWLIESGLLLVFFYLMVNSSQESFYMFDQGYFLKTHLFSWKLFIFKCILVVSLITYSYLLLLNLKWSTFNKNILSLLLLTVLLLYLLWTEFYQIYWVSNFYANFSWLYDMEELVWSLEFDGRRTRILNHYVMVLFLLKFWHIVFIFACWIFFLLRSNELEVITYPLYTFNFQNFIILFLMMWLFMYPWFKHSYHWISEIPYFWFYVDTHISFIKILINDLSNFYYYFIKNIFLSPSLYNYVTTDFINWQLIDGTLDFNVFIKSTIKNEIIKNLI